MDDIALDHGNIGAGDDDTSINDNEINQNVEVGEGTSDNRRHSTREKKVPQRYGTM